MDKDKGWVKLHRKFYDSDISRMPPHFREVWLYLLANANHKADNAAKIQRGQLYRTYDQIANDLAWYEGFIKNRYTKNQIRSAMVWLRENAMVSTRKTTRGNLITICKYDSYQDATHTEAHADKTQDKRTVNAINKNDKNGKEEPPISPLEGESSVSATQYDLKKDDQAKIVFDQTTIEQIAMAVNLTIPEMRRAYHYWKDDRIEKHREIDTLDALRAGFRRYLRNARDKWKANKNPMA